MEAVAEKEKRRQQPPVPAAVVAGARVSRPEMLPPPPPGNRHRSQARGRRRELLLARLCLVGSLTLLLASLSSWAGRSGYDVLSYPVETYDKWSGRRLLQATEDNATEIPEETENRYVKNCTEPGSFQRVLTK
ncbi:solute carrier family 24 (sodium/potassium/calcium exchanger), member 3 [Platysternon megacephalum]|uniref:Solute carrier family 24 (Sodium/potassium/calcium exchanger), member 3 n=1 Tax=Platysternon megacephalum TaxID=55544 RepID=A0A4D9ERC2_9SAUR|nr:solute carrier family 24 (sodium/potassium/calcium exchanger), member 3 [Platysternon megacephalum]